MASAKGTVGAMLEAYRSKLGEGEPNQIPQAWYRKRNGSDYAGNFAWCNATVTWAAFASGNYNAVCHGKDRAYTPEHAQVFRDHGEWVAGTDENVRKAKPGWIVFFDWGGTNGIGAIDHVGIVEKNLHNGTVQTMEGNTSDRLLRRVRGASVIAGFGVPKYAPELTRMEKLVKDMPELAQGARGEDVQTMQALLIARSHPEVKITGIMNAVDVKALKAFQKWAKISDDGVCGMDTWTKLLRR